jgi:glycerol uptake facilitator-like aquaporin
MGKVINQLRKLFRPRANNRFLKEVVELFQQFFITLLVTFLLLMLVETVWKDSVSSRLNLNYLLIIVIVVGVIAIFTQPEKVKEEEKRHLSRTDAIMIACVGLGGAAIVWYKTQEIGWLSYIISVVSGGLIVLLSILIWQGDQGEENEGEDSQDS